MCWYIRNKHLLFLLRWNTTVFWKVYVERERSSITHLILKESLLYKKCICFSRFDQITSKINDDEWKMCLMVGQNTKPKSVHHSIWFRNSLFHICSQYLFCEQQFIFFKLKLDSRKSFSSIIFNVLYCSNTPNQVNIDLEFRQVLFYIYGVLVLIGNRGFSVDLLDIDIELSLI